MHDCMHSGEKNDPRPQILSLSPSLYVYAMLKDVEIIRKRKVMNGMCLAHRLRVPYFNISSSARDKMHFKAIQN